MVLRWQGIRNAQKLGNSTFVDPGDDYTVIKLGGWVCSEVASQKESELH